MALREADIGTGTQESIDTNDKGRVTITTLKGADRNVEGGEGRGASSIHSEGGATPVEAVGNTVSNISKGIA